MQSDFRQVWLTEDKVATKLVLFSYLTLAHHLVTTRFGWTRGSLRPLTSIAAFDVAVQQHYYNARDFHNVEETGSLVIKVLTLTVLPLFFGIVGACAYITRLISDEIRDSTFSSTSSVQHVVRVVLGALAGVVVGLGWIGSGGSSTSPPALAFIAGYAVEPVFAAVDSIAEQFRRT